MVILYMFFFFFAVASQGLLQRVILISEFEGVDGWTDDSEKGTEQMSVKGGGEEACVRTACRNTGTGETKE